MLQCLHHARVRSAWGGAGEAPEHDMEKTPTKAEPMAKVIKMRQTASADAETVDVTVVMRRKTLLLSLQNLPWLLEYLRAEIEEVPAVGETSGDDEKTSVGSRIFWDSHNSCLGCTQKGCKR